jgi:NAD(P)-dependent dehydrogenase (short-subunit alcohol dehydrogenase family)
MALQGSRIVVIGGGSGIGLAVAQLACERRAEVVIAGRDASRLEAAAATLSAAVATEVADATDRTSLDRMFSRIGAFDHLVLSISSGGGAGPFATLDFGTLRCAIEGKLVADLQAAQASLASLRENGSITFITAASARAAFVGTAGLAAINGALNAAVPALALELKPRRVNAVCPGIVATPIWDRWPPEQRKAMLEREAQALPVGRIGQPGEVAQAVVMLLENAFMTGAIIDCDGGARIK